MRLIVGWMIGMTFVISGCVLGTPSIMAFDIGGMDGGAEEAAAKCEGNLIIAIGGSADERNTICTAGHDALQLLGRCGISLRRPLRVHIQWNLRHPLGGPILGYFDPKREIVVLTQPAIVASLVTGTPYNVLPHDEFYKSVVVHEIVHGVMHQNLRRPATSQAAYEYPAYALQIASLPPTTRSQFLQSFDIEVTPPNAKFNDALLSFDPYFFAVRTYEHFKASRDGCSHLTALLEGGAHFIVP